MLLCQLLEWLICGMHWLCQDVTSWILLYHRRVLLGQHLLLPCSPHQGTPYSCTSTWRMQVSGTACTWPGTSSVCSLSVSYQDGKASQSLKCTPPSSASCSWCRRTQAPSHFARTWQLTCQVCVCSDWWHSSSFPGCIKSPSCTSSWSLPGRSCNLNAARIYTSFA